MSKKNNNNDKLMIFALGGVGEIGKNMYVVQYANDIVVVDAGLKFPEEDMLGIDIVIPDISYLTENRDKVRGIVLTHGHEDHIGGLAYVLKNLNVPVYGTRLTLGLVENKLKEANLLGETKRILINEDSVIDLGTSLQVTFFRTNHSIPDSVGVCIETPEGNVVHTGDFKFDHTPVNGQYANLHRMAEIGQKGVLALMSDSTNAEKPGFTPSEKNVGIVLEDIFRKAEQRVVVATFASNVHRIQQVVNAAESTGRKITVIGRSMVNVVAIASELGYLNVPDGMLIEPEEMNRMAANRVVVLCTGSQGEPMSALTRMARSSHRKVDILPGDTVIIAATPVPGNEKYVGRTIDELFRLGANVIYSGSNSGVHVSGHGSQEELKLMLNLMKPKYFIPIHGEFRMQRRHALLAESVGVDPSNIFITEIGEVIEIQGGGARRAGKVTAGNVLIDGLGVGDVGNIVLRDRKLLSQDGILVVVVTLSKQNGAIVSGPDIISRGFVYVRESEGLLDEANRIVSSTLQRLMSEKVNEWASLKTSVKDSLGRFLYEQTRRRPMILPIIMEV
ncbi:MULTISPECIES: ribonuclease J [unclassified Paenibacillus]|uniref:ribonuclease J n=1 Tax=unclassified Paenibacillus TaxID=185978 RepID=UPI002405CC8A|nr:MULTISPECIES: ribonuclease J [unclassified Paenibacillus]MDF9841325.1 ribonuclease J [Paenibacillus sp. PastF-2]MDF9847916.1 ribonuclease J [Paenibacillus sp. PastM-2]MDF9854484.1 ribonuclease J [Paenibacillus sp. PastF-1]MDH6479907.1 ribonuclease J [Paenibacillus sp. PastH-2]MDH6507191.1 ribonuclease J [Paenibacillus sp. PastM-3]